MILLVQSCAQNNSKKGRTLLYNSLKSSAQQMTQIPHQTCPQHLLSPTSPRRNSDNLHDMPAERASSPQSQQNHEQCEEQATKTQQTNG